MNLFYTDRKNLFKEVFNSETGFYVRTGVFDENGKDTGVDPFMRSYPQLLDVGIMGSCEHGKSGLCMKAGIQCYQDGLKTSKPHMKLEDFKSIVDQSEGKVFQIALGGRGDPNKHPHFKEIVEYCREHNIAPNYTTSGLNLTDEEVQVTKEFTGAVACSWYRNDHTIDAITRFLDAGCKTNIHYVLSKSTIDEAIRRLVEHDFPEGINAIIFLLHKPVGLGKESEMLHNTDPRLKTFFDLINDSKFPFKIGFDACSVPGIINHTTNINPDSIDSCEGSRYSAYVTSDMKMLPCSFDNDKQRWAVDLYKHSIQEAWDSEEFDSFRSHFTSACPSCDDRLACLGGCPIVNDIVLCSRDERKTA
jgi:radical SAM protein with 4Fe4S-binding SPASM domain